MKEVECQPVMCESTIMMGCCEVCDGSQISTSIRLPPISQPVFVSAQNATYNYATFTTCQWPCLYKCVYV